MAAVGFGMTVYAYRARDGQALWTARLSGFPAGSQIVSVRVWPGVVTVGVVRARAGTRAPAGAATGTGIAAPDRGRAECRAAQRR